MRKLLLIIFVLSTTYLFSFSQIQDNSLGFRFGPSYGITYKHALSKKEAFEGLLTSKWNALLVTGLYEIHAHALDERYLYWFYGGGAHVGSNHLSNKNVFDNQNTTIVGIDGIIGLVYYLQDIPFNVSMEWKPMINFIGADLFWPEEIAISVRYILN